MAIKHPNCRHWKIPKKRRFRFLRENLEAGKYERDFDSVNRRKSFVFYRDNGGLPRISTKKCYVCEFKVANHWHHIVPIRKGGDDTDRNLVPLCVGCHKKVHRRGVIRPNRDEKGRRFVSPLTSITKIVYVPPSLCEK